MVGAVLKEQWTKNTGGYTKAEVDTWLKTKVDGKMVGGELGPDLSSIGLIQGPDYLHDSIVKPSDVVVAGYQDVMPKHFAENPSAKYITNRIVFLPQTRGS